MILSKNHSNTCALREKAQKELDAKFFARFFKLTKSSIKDQLLQNCSDRNEFNQCNLIKN